MWVCMGVLLNVIWPYWRGLVFHIEAMAATLGHKQVFPGGKKKKSLDSVHGKASCTAIWDLTLGCP